MTRGRQLMRALAVPLLLATLITVSSQPAYAGARSMRFRNEMLRLVNETRSSHGLHTLRLNRPLSGEAWRHSVAMGRSFVLFHTTNLSSLVQPYDAYTWGENVAYAATLRRVEQLWMQSPEHRNNLLNPAFRWAAIGVIKARGWLWVTLQLYG
jgi:uncharacterized protein YkwD